MQSRIASLAEMWFARLGLSVPTLVSAVFVFLALSGHIDPASPKL